MSTISKPVMFAMETMSLGGITLPPAKTKQVGNVTYHRYPVAVIGRRSDNGTFYNVRSFIDAASNPNGLFFKHVSTGRLYSELDHPDLTLCKSNEEVIRRLHTTVQDRYCAHIESIEFGKPMSDGAQVVFAWMTPHGLLKSDFEDGINNPAVNVSWSLRSSIKNEVFKDATRYRDIEQLVTFDKVTRGGFNEASKAFAAMENVQYSHVRNHGVNISATVVAYECARDTEINDALESSAIYFISQTTTHVRTDMTYLVDDKPLSPMATLKSLGITI